MASWGTCMISIPSTMALSPKLGRTPTSPTQTPNAKVSIMFILSTRTHPTSIITLTHFNIIQLILILFCHRWQWPAWRSWDWLCSWWSGTNQASQSVRHLGNDWCWYTSPRHIFMHHLSNIRIIPLKITNIYVITTLIYRLSGETDWKILVLDVNDPLASQVNST